MTRQVEAETQQALALRTAARDKVAKAFASGNFAGVPVQPYLTAPQGTTGFPPTAAMETKGLTFYGTDTPPGTAQDVGSIQKQINVLEALRRAELARRQSRRDMLAHLTYEFVQADLHDTATLKVFVGSDKVALP
jgi:hypothetical protein